MAVAIVSVIKGVFLVGIAVIVVAVTVRTINFSKPKPSVQECKATDADFIPLDEKRLSHFQEALRFKTISRTPGDYEREELFRLGDFIISSFPRIHKESPHVEWERVNNYSLLYQVKGSNPDLKPYLLMSHLDVVPVTDPDVWDAPAFSAKVQDGFIYGRGTIDVKQTVMGILEALEYLLEHNMRPERSFFVAIGHDEEVLGNDGAGHLSKRLREKGVTELEYISDEGLVIGQGMIPGVEKPIAHVGVVEKGRSVLKLWVKGEPGHSSIPKEESAITILARAVHRLQANPLASMFGQGVEKEMFETVAREGDIVQRILLANIWLFEPVISWFLSLKPTTKALTRTVSSVTMFNAGVKVNVLPPYAEAFVDYRIHPAQTLQEIIEHVRRVIQDDRVNIDIEYSSPPHPTAGFGDYDFGYQVVKTSINQVWPDAAVGPGMMAGCTDTKYYLNFTHDVYRFSPTFMRPGDPERFHGNNERISVKNYEQVINFYYHLMRNSDQPGVSPTHKPHEEF